jgi:hypothetical protein
MERVEIAATLETILNYPACRRSVCALFVQAPAGSPFPYLTIRERLARLATWSICFQLAVLFPMDESF